MYQISLGVKYVNKSPHVEFRREIFKHMKRIWIPIKISLKFVPNGAMDNKSAVVQVMSWHRKGDKPLPVPMLTQFTDAYVQHYWDMG